MTDNINLEFKHSANRNSWFNLEEKEGAEDNDTVKRDITSWFSANQKTEYFDSPKIYKLHLIMITLVAVAYICHILPGPFIKLTYNEWILLATGSVECFCLVVAFICLVIMIRVNSSKASMKLIFGSKSVKTYIFVYWIVRSLVLEICKGQVLFAFLHVFHSILVYSTDVWYQCDKKLLIFNIALLLAVFMYEFLISVSPYGPQEPKWVLFRVKTTPNVLSRSNYLNLFLIFFDGLLVAIFNVRRQKYIMLAKKQRRLTKALSPGEKKTLSRLWLAVAVSACASVIVFISRNFLPYCEHSHDWVTPSCVVYNLVFMGFTLTGVICMMCIIRLSCPQPWRIFFKLVKERRIIYIIFMLVVLCYVDNSLGPNMPGISFPIIIMLFISMDFISDSAFVSKTTPTVILAVVASTLVWNIARSMFFNPYCGSLKFRWGLYGESISYCTIKRITHSSLTSLLVKPILGCLYDTKKMFFISANVFRSTGTNSRKILKESYVNNLAVEMEKSIKKNFPTAESISPNHL